MPSLLYFIKALLRRKHIEQNSLTQTRLDRCLSTLDLTALGIGSTLGLGIYVLAGEVASRTAGPAVTLSFFVAAVASVFAGLCYAEFGARVPKAGSAYVYSYVTVGELMAFIIGWNLVLEYVIGTASVARGYSLYIDALVNGTIQKHFREWMPMDVNGLSAYPDFLAFGITLLLTVMLSVGVKESTRFNSIFTFLNLLVVLFIVIAGSFKASVSNWTIPEKDIPEGYNGGSGGFLPFGFSGMMAGAATCFYGFIGFDVIATTGEEARNPQRSIPIGIVISLLFVFLAYFGVSAVQTLMMPYYLQTEDLTAGAPLPYVFEHAGWPVAKWIISIGALTGLSTSLLGAMFPLPRVLYSMASDGVIFRWLATVHPKFKTPLLATFLSGLLAGGMAAMFDVKELADMMSIGTLLAYTLVAISVLILRYRYNANKIGLSDSDDMAGDVHEVTPLKDSVDNEYKEDRLQPFPTSPGSDNSVNTNQFVGSSNDSNDNRVFSYKDILRQTFNVDRLTSPTPLSSLTSVILIISSCIVLIILDSLLVALEDRLADRETTAIVVVSVMFALLIVNIAALGTQPSSAKRISFQVPLVPWIPFLSVFVNFYLMLKLSRMTWIRFAVWMFIGLSIYFLYGLWNSNERERDEKKKCQPNVKYETKDNTELCAIKD
ncbi:high affinity cationic amino acid transporter 1-like isoform X2 [Oppia nitens]|uniref:high affinity cationic amino acid transporter 1-like isoform X2 n=1 Tax=Oppia nitens TaxID=1686743 RepID=UPI0023DCDDC5|nr:high affinity cationic amino acid transporter 1-like isoform X2 [Oppia nitens]